MTINQLECFVEAVDSASISKAAARLYISQPSLSRQINALEKEMDLKLLHRSSVGVTLTESGRLFYDVWKEFLIRNRIAMDTARSRENSKGTNLRIGVMDMKALETLVEKKLPSFNQKKPKLNIEYRAYPASKLLTELENGSIQIAITIEANVLNNSQLHVLSMNQTINAGIVIAKNSPLGKRKSIRWEDLKGQTFAVSGGTDYSDHRDRLTADLKEHGILDDVLIQEFDSQYNSMLAVSMGRCVATMFEHLVEDFKDYVNFYPLENDAQTARLVIVWKEDVFETTAIELAADFTNNI